MKKHTKFSRLLSLLLVLAMAVSFLPVSALAAKGDVTNVTTGLTGDIDTDDTISLPVKILDYKADGMLFEFANGNGYKTALEFGATFSNENPTRGNGLNRGVLDNRVDAAAEATYEDNNYVKYVHVAWKSDAGGSAGSYFPSRVPVLLTPDGFGDEKGTFDSWDVKTTPYTTDSVRYLVLVLRSNATGTKSFTVGLNRTGIGGANTATNRTGEITSCVNDPVFDGETWTYVILDLKQGSLGNNWTNGGNVKGVFAGLPLDQAGEWMDIAHIAYFSELEQAKKYAEYSLTDGSERGDNRSYGFLYGSRHEEAATNSYDSLSYMHSDKVTRIDATSAAQDFASVAMPNTLGYQLLGELRKGGIATVGMLESALSPKGYPVYKEQVVTFLGGLLEETLQIPEHTDDGWRNYLYIQGEESDVYGGTDLATALRSRITGDFGSYAATKAKGDQLVGTWGEVKDNIKTYCDAAYFLLNSIFVPGSYNEPQSDYDYLVLSAGTDSVTGDKIHVFDAGFANTKTPVVTTPPAIDYNEADNSIQNSSAAGKAHFYYDATHTTTLNPFLPVTAGNNAAGQTKTAYIQDDGALNTAADRDTLVNRNFGYVLSSYGEFVYHADDELFFDFEGDDDVYLFINGELVMDIGAAHSIDGVRFNLNDYVNAAKAGTLEGGAGQNEREKKLSLEEGKTYPFHFFYMERHSYGANIRISTNIHVTDPNMKTEKTAYQNGSKINYGGVVAADQTVEYGFSITNTGNQRLFNLTFTDNTIGVKLDPTNGLIVTGANAQDVNGGTLEASDLVAYVDGYYDWDSASPSQKMDTVKVTFANNEELKAFLKNLYAAGTVAGDGLWQYSTVQIRGIGYKLTEEQASASKFENIVFTTANTEPDGSGTPLRGQADMLVFVPTDPMYYHWAEHELVVTRQKFISDVMFAAEMAGNPLQGKVPNLKADNVNKMELTTSAGTPITNPSVTVTNDSLTFNYTTPGSFVVYVKVTYNSSQNSHVIPVLINVTAVQDTYLVLDYGLKATLTEGGAVFKNDAIDVPGRLTGNSILAVGSGGSYADNHISFTSDADGKIRVENGNGEFSLNIASQTLTYTPDDFMDMLESIQMAMNVYELGTEISALGAPLDINNEVQMYKNVGILPATVVYYEDDFPAIHYQNITDDGVVDGVLPTFEAVGSSSGLNQGVDQDQEYGQDDTYKDPSNDKFSGGSYHKISIKDANRFAWFQFTGTGFELISRTVAECEAIIVVTVMDSNNNTVKRIPVITEYDNGADGGEDCIYQVPVIRVDDLPLDEYKVYINGVPAYKLNEDRNGYELDENGEKIALDTYMYLDGLRIFQPMGGENDNYSDKENGATFQEIRDLIITGDAAAVAYDGKNITASTKTVTWTENRLGVDSSLDDDEAVEFNGNEVDSVEDYLIMGPNNEVYMNGDHVDSALVFYVTKNADAPVSMMQIAVRAIDKGLFHGTSSLNELAEIQVGVKNGDSYAWQPLVTVESSTEQYYTIDLNKCPVDEMGRIQVVVKVNKGMASFSTVKYNGITIANVGGEATDLRYTEGVLGDIDGNPVDAAAYPAFAMLRRQMAVSTLSLEPDVTEPDETEPDVTEPDETEPDVTEPGETEPDVTEPGETEPDVTEPDETEPDVTEPDVTEPDVTEPGETEPEETEPTEPEETEPEEEKPGQGSGDLAGNLLKSLLDTIRFLWGLIGRKP